MRLNVMNHKKKLSIVMLMLFLCSLAVTIAFQNIVSDSISISFSVALAFGLVLVLPFIMMETIREICNP
ncbi:hypothetical protein G9F31_08855 [Acinetobacter sp. 187]|uniref:hypothetical protein n=1 Tax=Acinetobacter lanii TaxID=2715163 RepID=UPI00140A38A2|nr:hypothetical protein [Acinetobacter lanii]NHC03878.1 hypothetical protein [Acinetobacter lanii]